MADETVKKPKLEDEDKEEIGQRLGMIIARYPTSRKLREADVNITITVFVGKTKSSTTGTLVDVTGKVENIDFTMSRVVVDGKKYKLSEIIDDGNVAGFKRGSQEIRTEEISEVFLQKQATFPLLGRQNIVVHRHRLFSPQNALIVAVFHAELQRLLAGF